MKKFVEIEKQFGEGGAVGAEVGAHEGNFVAQVAVKYPIAKVVEPATKAVDNLLDKLEKLIPGDWDKAPIEKIKEEYKQELVELISQ